jgi:hypothetical protein
MINMRAFLFEFEDLKWFPDFLRQSMTDYLRYFLNATNFYKPTTRLLNGCLEQSRSNNVIDLCSGGGGAIESVVKNIKHETGKDIHFILTDKFPNIEAFSFLKKQMPDNIDFVESSVDAGDVPAALTGVRTVYSAIHHFDREAIKTVIRDAVKANAPIAIFDGGDKNLLTIMGIIIFHPIAFFLCTPFFKPFRLSRILFTYLIPLIPLCAIWDGAVSITRLYHPRDLLEIAKEAGGDYEWKAGKAKNHFQMNVAYLTGIPKIYNEHRKPYAP